jgi:hypothetical protein
MSIAVFSPLRYAILALGMLLLSSLPVVAASSSLTLYTSPYAAPSTTSSQTPLAQISYDASAATASLISYTPPAQSSSAETSFLRVGFTDPKTGYWRGIVTDAASLTNQYKKNILVHVDERGEVYHIGMSTGARTNSASGEDDVHVELVQRRAGPRPVLNQPIVLNAEGKLDGKEPEKTFLQKYWWALLLFVAVQLFAGGGDK